MRILHVATGLNTGGAEVQLCGLCEHLQKLGYRQKVISLLPEGALSPWIRDLGIECTHLGLRQAVPDPRQLGVLRKEIASFQPMVVHSWMYHACVYSSVASMLMRPEVPQLWSIHFSSLGFAGNSFSTLSSIAACRVLSYQRRVHIAYCAEAAKREHEVRGFCTKRGEFLPNGYNSGKFRRKPETRDRIRAELKIPDDAIAIGMAARYELIKDHASFLQAAALARKESPRKLVFVLCGGDINESNRTLMSMIETRDLGASVVLAGKRADMESVYSAFDFLALSSRGEAFPNVICEGMLSELPCISTDVGDCRAIIGDTGILVNPGSPAELAAAFRQAANLAEPDRRSLGQRARARIMDRYSVQTYLSHHTELYNRLAGSDFGVSRAAAPRS